MYHDHVEMLGIYIENFLTRKKCWFDEIMNNNPIKNLRWWSHEITEGIYLLSQFF